MNPHYMDMYPVLQYRWKLEENLLKYYGLRNFPHTMQRIIKLTPAEITLIKTMDGKKNLREIASHFKLTKRFYELVKHRIIVDKNDVRKSPNSLEDTRYCIKCIANDFIIPGLEFDSTGKCALCQYYERIIGRCATPLLTLTKQDLLKHSQNNKNSRFDVALMYTGGKDSSYLLYFLAKICNLRVLACTWTIPYLSSNAKANIQAAKLRLKNVEFIERNVLPEDLNIMYKASLKLQGNTCLCPSLAYVIFYPLLVSENISFIVSGIEDAQHHNMVLNGFIPLHIYKLANSSLIHVLVNLLRIFTLRPPYKKGQLSTIMYLRQLAFGNTWVKKILGYQNEMVEHLYTVFNTAPDILRPLAATLKTIDRNRNIPMLVNIDLNSISPNGLYDWNSIKEILRKELGWSGTGENSKDKGLHTSCMVEDGKDYSQFIRFRNMESMIIPFSAIELSNAVLSGNTTRAQALRELQNMPGFCLKPPPGYQLMHTSNGLPYNDNHCK